MVKARTTCGDCFVGAIVNSMATSTRSCKPNLEIKRNAQQALDALPSPHTRSTQGRADQGRSIATPPAHRRRHLVPLFAAPPVSCSLPSMHTCLATAATLTGSGLSLPAADKIFPCLPKCPLEEVPAFQLRHRPRST